MLDNQNIFEDEDIAEEDVLEEDENDQVFFLYNQLINLDYADIENIQQIEISLYKELNAAPDDNLAILGLMQTQLMLGNRDKAKDFAYSLWDKGEQLDAMEEYIYIKALINLGLWKMASILLKPHFEQLSRDIDKFFKVMIKFSTMIGNLYLLERLLSNPKAPNIDMGCKEIVALYKQKNYDNHLKNIMKIVHEHLGEKLCACEYQITPENLDICLYIPEKDETLTEINSDLQAKFNDYYQKFGISGLDNFSISLYSISQHLKERMY